MTGPSIQTSMKLADAIEAINRLEYVENFRFEVVIGEKGCRWVWTATVGGRKCGDSMNFTEDPVRFLGIGKKMLEKAKSHIDEYTRSGETSNSSVCSYHLCPDCGNNVSRKGSDRCCRKCGWIELEKGKSLEDFQTIENLKALANAAAFEKLEKMVHVNPTLLTHRHRDGYTVWSTSHRTFKTMSKKDFDDLSEHKCLDKAIVDAHRVVVADTEGKATLYKKLVERLGEASEEEDEE